MDSKYRGHHCNLKGGDCYNVSCAINFRCVKFESKEYYEKTYTDGFKQTINSLQQELERVKEENEKLVGKISEAINAEEIWNADKEKQYQQQNPYNTLKDALIQSQKREIEKLKAERDQFAIDFGQHLKDYGFIPDSIRLDVEGQFEKYKSSLNKP